MAISLEQCGMGSQRHLQWVWPLGIQRGQLWSLVVKVQMRRRLSRWHIGQEDEVTELKELGPISERLKPLLPLLSVEPRKWGQIKAMLLLQGIT